MAEQGVKRCDVQKGSTCIFGPYRLPTTGCSLSPTALWQRLSPSVSCWEHHGARCNLGNEVARAYKKTETALNATLCRPPRSHTPTLSWRVLTGIQMPVMTVTVLCAAHFNYSLEKKRKLICVITPESVSQSHLQSSIKSTGVSNNVDYGYHSMLEPWLVP